MKKYIAVISAVCLILASLGLVACSNNKQNSYGLTVNGSDYLFENLKNTYEAGETVKVKTKIMPYKGVKVLLDAEPLVKVKSAQDDFYSFPIEMPAHDATIDITYFEKFEEPLLYGFHVTFNDKNGNPIESFNKDVKSKEAVADYATPYYDENGTHIIANYAGAAVFAEGKQSIGDGEFELENTLYFTYELLDAVAVVDWVFYDEKTRGVYSCRETTGLGLTDIGTLSAFTAQHLTDFRFNAQMQEYEETFDSYVKLNMKYIDYLTGVKVLEYGADNVLIKTTDIAKFDSEKEYNASESCEYVVIEEKYAVKNDEKRNGETYHVRTLINKSELGDGRMLKYPRGDGLISPAYLSVEW